MWQNQDEVYAENIKIQITVYRNQILSGIFYSQSLDFFSIREDGA